MEATSLIFHRQKQGKTLSQCVVRKILGPGVTIWLCHFFDLSANAKVGRCVWLTVKALNEAGSSSYDLKKAEVCNWALHYSGLICLSALNVLCLLFSAFKGSAELERDGVGNIFFFFFERKHCSSGGCWFSGFLLKVIAVNFKINPVFGKKEKKKAAAELHVRRVLCSSGMFNPDPRGLMSCFFSIRPCLCRNTSDPRNTFNKLLEAKIANTHSRFKYFSHLRAETKLHTLFNCRIYKISMSLHGAVKLGDDMSTLEE